VVRQFAGERLAGESFRRWLDRRGGVDTLTETLRDLDAFPEPDIAPEYYVDYDETGPYAAETGDSECAV
jgi:hypothetical protein